jgi:maleylpyruvate isomerase
LLLRAARCFVSVLQDQPVKDDPEPDAIAIIDICRAAHRRLIAAVTGLPDETVRRPSRLPGWTVGHVLTHLARNADGHARRLEGALRGKEVARYPGGQSQRNKEIEAGAVRSARDLADDVAASAERLEDVWSQSAKAGWPNRHLLAGDRWPTDGSPSRRLREVEVHHVDLGLGYTPEDWPEEYVHWELALVLGELPHRLPNPADRRRILAWLIGRAEQPKDVALDPWL